MTTLKAKVSGSWVTIGGAGVGVPVGGTTGQILTKASATDYATQWSTPLNVLPPGGATNALLAKASAADYATAWTTAPILTGLTSSGHISLANSMALRGKTTGGVDERAVILAGDNDLYLGVDMAAGRRIILGGSGANAQVQNDLSVLGTLVSKHAVRAAGIINGSTGALASGFGLASATRVSVGVYNVTLSAALTAAFPTVTNWGTNGGTSFATQTLSTTVIEVRAFYPPNPPTAADTWFVIHVVST